MKKLLLSINNIFVRYDKLAVVNGVSLQVDKGTIVTIIGRNGAGKTTTLKAISGLLPCVSGKILFQGERIENHSPAHIVKAGISHVPQGRGLFSEMSVLENLYMGAYRRKDGKGLIARDLGEVFKIFPILKQRQKQYAGSLSGGEQQLLSIARALMSNPELLILDEPSMGLAPLMRNHIAEIITDICHGKGIGVVLAEQNASFALGFADRAYVLDSGQCVLEGAAKALLADDQVRKIYLGIK